MNPRPRRIPPPRTEEGRIAAASPSGHEAAVRDPRIHTPCKAVEDRGRTDFGNRAVDDLDRLDREITNLRLRIGLVELRNPVLETSDALDGGNEEEPFGMP